MGPSPWAHSTSAPPIPPPTVEENVKLDKRTEMLQLVRGAALRNTAWHMHVKIYSK